MVDLSSFSDNDPVHAEAGLPRWSADAARARPGVIVLGGAQGTLAVARSLGRKGIPVWFLCSDHDIPRLSRYVRRTLITKDLAPQQVFELLCRLAKDEGVAGWVLFPAADAELQLVAQHHDELSKRYRLFTMPWSVLEQVNDKGDLAKLADSLGVSSPKVYDGVGPGDANTIRFPVIIKPRSTEKRNALTRAKAWRIDDAAEFPLRWKEATDLMGPDGFMVQEMIPGDGSTQFSYAGLWNRGREVSSLVVCRLRQFPADFGVSPFVETIDRPEIGDPARKILAAIDFHGLVEMDFKFDSRDGTYKPLDVNTRVWAWIGLTAASGHDFPWLAWQLANGIDPVPQPSAEKTVRWVQFTHNLLSILQHSARTKKLDGRDLRSIFLPSTPASFAWDDPLPGLLELPVLFGRLWGRLRRRA